MGPSAKNIAVRQITENHVCFSAGALSMVVLEVLSKNIWLVAEQADN
jgi:hypothetical protein